MKISLPYKFSWRSYQRELWDDMVYFNERNEPIFKKLRGCCVWHRRSGKDKDAINFMVTTAYYGKKGTYVYFFPTYAQGKKVIWDGMGRGQDGQEGFRFLDHIPPELRYAVNETEMMVTLKDRHDHTKPGSVVMIVGTDNIDRIVGMNILGAVYSEYSLQNPRAWKYVMPMLAENGGWAIFLFTPRGENHAYKIYQTALKHPDRWFCSLKTIDSTRRDADGEDGDPVVTQARIEQDIADGMDEDTVQQEYYCSFRAVTRGSYFGVLIQAARDEQRIVRVPWNPTVPVYTGWDIGVNDQTAVWFFQRMGEHLHAVDCFIPDDKTNHEGLPAIAKVLLRKPYIYEFHAPPFDAAVTEWGPGLQRKQQMESVGLRPVRVQPKALKHESREAARRVIPITFFDAEKCEDGVAALEAFHREYDEDTEVYTNIEAHDWASHPAKAFIAGAMAWRPGRGQIGRDGMVTGPQYKSVTEYNIFGGS